MMRLLSELPDLLHSTVNLLFFKFLIVDLHQPETAAKSAKLDSASAVYRGCYIWECSELNNHLHSHSLDDQFRVPD